jgi:putative DNA primase/helicase
MGYCLTGKTGEHKLFFFYGSGANGKTTFIKTKQGIMGNYAIKTDSELLISKPAGAHSTDRADLKGCRLAITVEIQEGRHLAEAIVKELTGGDSITARKLYENNQTFEPTHKIILAANHKPLIYETTNALWRRIDLIPFNYFFSEDERVKDYHDVLLNEERDGIFRWALEGCLEWRKIGLKEPPEVLAATKDYKTESDILEDFIADCCDIDPAVEVGNKDLRKVYDKWCHDNGEKEISAKAFSQRLQEKGYKKEKSGSKGRYWRGIGLKEDVSV